jgi:hypothetical protein
MRAGPTAFPAALSQVRDERGGQGSVKPLFTAPAWLAALIQAVPDLGISAVFLITWLRPDTFGPQFVRRLVLVMLLEFIVIHSAGFMGAATISAVSRLRRILVILGFGLFYSLFTGAFSLAFHTTWPFLSFWVLIANRMLGVVVSPAGDLKEANVVMLGWGLTVLAYLGCCFLTVLVPMPRFGITAEVVQRQAFTGGGLWIDQPHTAIAFGFFYFLVVGLGEILLVGKVVPSRRIGSS